MLNYKNFKKVYGPDGSYVMYLLGKVNKYTFGVVKATYLCLRFPFLYPRNNFTDRHYTNWNLRRKQSDIQTKWSNWAKDNKQAYIDKFGKESISKIKDSEFVKVDYVMKLATPKDRFLHWFYGFWERFLGIFHILPTYTRLGGMDRGWRKRFGIQFCKELKQAIKQSPNKDYMKKIRIMDMKEKWGEFQCYLNYYSPEVSRVINKYGYLSKYVCVRCGKDAVKQTLGWICPYCDDCLPPNQNWIWIDKVYGWRDPKLEDENKEKLKNLKRP